ncbi:MAG: Na(+)-translocating NADH-quinone reductase subunit A [Pseudomonadota bacterium]
MNFSFKKGLDLPVMGAPAPGIKEGPKIQTVAVVGADYLGLKPRLSVEEGQQISRGSPVFAHKDTPQVLVTSPVAGRVRSVNRGARRALISVEIDVTEDDVPPIDFSKIGDPDTAEGIAERLCAAGLWTSFRTRPYSKVPDPGTRPSALYVTAMDTEPLSPDAAEIIEDAGQAFELGLAAITALPDGNTYLCYDSASDMNVPDLPGLTKVSFSGPHPAGLPGTHMHFLEPPSTETTVWTIWYQDVIAIGRLMKHGTLDPERVIAISGPLVQSPRSVRTLMGASMIDLIDGAVDNTTSYRLISGSILSGRAGEGADSYLGRYDRQITVIEEDHHQIPLGWIRPMSNKYAYQPVLGSAFSNKLFELTSNLNGGRRAMVPLGTFEQLMPQDYLPTQLLRALLVMDTDSAQALGALELDEEDLGLVGFACPAKYEYRMALRDCLNKIEREG